MSPRVTWTIAHVANSALFVVSLSFLSGWSSLLSLIPLVFAIVSLGWAYNSGKGVDE